MPPVTRASQQKLSDPEPLDPNLGMEKPPPPDELSADKDTKPVVAPLYLMPLVLLVALLSVVSTTLSSIARLVFSPLKFAVCWRSKEKQ